VLYTYLDAMGRWFAARFSGHKAAGDAAPVPSEGD
jgi:hypothetical protein